MAQYIRKTVVIGLGGSGLKAIQHLKHKLQAQYGTIPICYKFLAFDTADQESLAIDGSDVTLPAGEFYRLSVTDPATYLQFNSRVREWFPANVPKRDLVDGAGQIRALGRLGLYFHAEDIYNRLYSIMEDVNNYKVGLIDSDKFEINNPDRLVLLVGSLAGGTGSGTLIELGAVIKTLLMPREKVIGMFLLPEGFVALPGCDRVMGNAYAALKEIDHSMSRSASEIGSFKFGDRNIETKYSPFDRILLISNAAQETRYVFDSLDSLTELLATGVLVASGAAGKKDKDIWDNLNHQLKSQGKWLGRPANYASFGLSELIYDRDVTIRNVKSRVALQVIEQIVSGEGRLDAQSQVDKLVDKLHIREEDPFNEVIDRILSSKDIFSPSAPDPTTENMMSLIKRRKLIVNDEHFRLQEAAKNKVETLSDELLGTLDQDLREFVRDHANLHGLGRILQGLASRANEYKAMMTNERIDFEKNLNNIEAGYDSILQDAQRASKRFFGGSKAREEVIDAFLNHVRNHLHVVMEIERRKAAAEIFQVIYNSSTSWQTQVENFQQNAKSLTLSFNETISRGISSSRSMKPFVKYVSYPATRFTTIPSDLGQFSAWLNEAKGKELHDLLAQPSSELKQTLFEFADQLDIVSEIRKATVEDVLREYSKDRMWEFIEDLNDMAAPLWQYNQAYTQGNLTHICIFATANPDSSVLQDKTHIRSLLNLPYEPSIVANGDPLRLLCFKIEAQAPAYALNRIARYKEQYSIGEDGCTYHIGTDFSKADDLMPLVEDVESRRYWSVGFADVFNLLVKSGTGTYYVRSKVKGRATEDYLVKLEAAGRVAAMKSFVANRELVEEMEKEVNAVVDRLGTMEVARQLREYRARLIDGIASQKTKPEYQDLLNEEIQDIDGFVEQLESWV